MWHLPDMAERGTQSRLAPRLVDSLYVEAMVLTDEVRGYFDGIGREERDGLAPLVQVGFACESMKITTRLMQIVGWLLTRRAVEAGEILSIQARDRALRLGEAADSDPVACAGLPETARGLIETSRELYQRVRRIDADLDLPEAPPSPALGLISRLERAF